MYMSQIIFDNYKRRDKTNKTPHNLISKAPKRGNLSKI